MSTAARKARKKAGIKFTRTPKTPTPVDERTEAIRARDRQVLRSSESIFGRLLGKGQW